MTQAQQTAVITAQKRFFDAENAASSAQSASAQAEAAVEAARTNATVTAPAQAHKLVQDANDSYFAALATQQTVIANAQNAQVTLSQARLDLNQAILDSLQTGAVEKVTGQTTTY
jgi:predicted negative regulator of RcsB-dependent stress response